MGENKEDHEMTFNNIEMTKKYTFSNLQPQFDVSGPAIPVAMCVERPAHSHEKDNNNPKFDCSRLL